MASTSDTAVSKTNTWSTPILLAKGDPVSVSVKGTFVGTIKVRRWHSNYGINLYTDSVEAPKHIGVIQSYTSAVELVDVSAGSYYYQIGTDETWTSGTAYTHVQ